jgi:nucleoside-diphosphate-sugar epimerase
MPTPLLVVGGSGYVGRLVLPFLVERFHLRIFDRVTPAFLPLSQKGERGQGGEGSAWEYVPGDVTDPEALHHAAQGMELLLYLAMGTIRDLPELSYPIPSYDVNVKGLHLALDAAVRSGIRRAVYTSSLSVYDGHLSTLSGQTDREDVKPEPRSVYGFTKLLGEEVCRYFHRTHHLPVLVLRLHSPVSREQWHALHNPAVVQAHTSAPDLARALIAALELEHSGFEILHITGDYTGRAYRHEKAKRLLGWEPLERP